MPSPPAAVLLRGHGRLQRWLAHGLAAGACVAFFEALFTAGSGTNVPLTYLLLIVTVDLGAGILLGALLAQVSRLPGLWRRDFAAVFALSAIGATVLFQLGKIAGAASYRGFFVPLAVAATLILTGLSVPAVAWLLRRTCRTPAPGASLALSLGLLGLWLVAGRHLTKVLFQVYFTPQAVMANVILLIALFLAIVAQDRLMLRLGPRPRLSPFAFSLLAVLVAYAAGVGAWTVAQSPPFATAAFANTGLADTESGSSLEGGPNVVLITLDTLRADRLSVYGYRRATSPALEALARDAVVYSNAVSPAAWTLPGHASLFTGTLPRRHGAHNPESSAPSAPAARALLLAPTLHPENLTLAEILSRHGYRTAAVSANHLFVSRKVGLAQGFEVFDDRPGVKLGYLPAAHPLMESLQLFPLRRLLKDYRTAAEINSLAIAWLEAHGRGRPFLLFLNYMDPHRPYCPPAPYDRSFPGIRLRMRWPEDAIHRRKRKLTRREREHYAAAYDGEIAYLDHHLGELFAHLKSAGLYDEALIIVTSDHGELFGEHDLMEHGYGPYEPVYRVPLLIKYPGGTPTGRVDRRVSTVQVLPTLLDVLGLPEPPGLDAVALGDEGQEIIAEQYLPMFLWTTYGERFRRGYRTLYEGPWKLVRFSDGELQLFNLEMDPREDHDLAARHPEVAEELANRLDEHMRAVTPIADRQPAPQPVDEEQRRKLKALGYIG